MNIPLYPAIRTWGACFRCSLRRLPRVWSSLSKMKSDVLDMPFRVSVSTGPIQEPSGKSHTCKRLLGDLLLPGGFIEEKELETADHVSTPRTKNASRKEIVERRFLSVIVFLVHHLAVGGNSIFLQMIGCNCRSRGCCLEKACVAILHGCAREGGPVCRYVGRQLLEKSPW